MSRRSLNLEKGLYDYLLSVSLREPEILQRLRAETARLANANMQISPEQGQFMHWLVSTLTVKNIIEVGTFTGYSALSMAMALPEDGVIECCDISQDWTDIARRYWDDAGLAEKFRLHLAPAAQTLQKMVDQGRTGEFDLAFIDADKEGYLSYYELCLQLLRQGGVIIVDNTLWGGAVIAEGDQSPDTMAIREFNRYLFADQRVELSMLPISDGLTLVKKM